MTLMPFLYHKAQKNNTAVGYKGHLFHLPVCLTMLVIVMVSR